MTYQSTNILKSIEQSKPMNASSALKGGYDIFNKDPGNIILALIVMGVLSAASNWLFPKIELDFLTSAYSILVDGVLAAGWFYMAHSIATKGKTSVDELFKGFKNNFKDIVVSQLLIFLIVIGVSLVFVVAFFSEFLTQWMDSGFNSSRVFLNSIEDISTLQVSLLGIFFVVLIYLSLIFLFTNPFIVFYNLSAWEAIKASVKLANKNIGMLIWFSILCFFVALAGVIALVIGLLVAVPVILMAQYVLFEQAMDIEFPDSRLLVNPEKTSEFSVNDIIEIASEFY